MTSLCGVQKSFKPRDALLRKENVQADIALRKRPHDSMMGNLGIGP